MWQCGRNYFLCCSILGDGKAQSPRCRLDQRGPSTSDATEQEKATGSLLQGIFVVAVTNIALIVFHLLF